MKVFVCFFITFLSCQTCFSQRDVGKCELIEQVLHDPRVAHELNIDTNHFENVVLMITKNDTFFKSCRTLSRDKITVTDTVTLYVNGQREHYYSITFVEHKEGKCDVTIVYTYKGIALLLEYKKQGNTWLLLNAKSGEI